MIRVAAAPWMPKDRVWLQGAPVRIKKVEFGQPTVENVNGSDVITIPVTYDVEYDPVYQAVIHLDE